MSQIPDVPHPLLVDEVARERASAGEIRLRVSGRWLAAAPPAESGEALLVIQIDGRRHRFAPDGEAVTPSPGRWSATFLLPGWAEPRREGQAALWIDDAVIPVPPPGVARREPGSGPPALGSAVPADEPTVPAWAHDPPPDTVTPDAIAPSTASALHDWVTVGSGLAETPRSGPLADVLLKETVAALHAELEARAAEAARLRAALGSAQSDLETRHRSQGELEGTLSELGAELRRLMEAVEEQRAEIERRDAEADRDRAEADRDRAEFDRRVAELAADRDARAAELAEVREQLARVQAELAGARDEHTTALATAEETARRRIADAAALREELAAAQVSRDAARGESAALQAELQRLGLELAATRERVGAETGDLGEANRLLADARALADQLRAAKPVS